MAYTALTLSERPNLERHFSRLHAAAWPTFLRDDAANALWPVLYSKFPEFQITLCDQNGSLVAVGNTIPIVWNGTRRGLPRSIVDIIKRGIESADGSRKPTTLCALAAIVGHQHRAKGLSARIIQEMRKVALAHGLRKLLAPVRPSRKGDYPLTPMKRYAFWKREDGSPLDPWLRVHWRLGARRIGIVERANSVAATVAEWEKWTGQHFPESGLYVVPGAFQPIEVDHARNRVRYEEANVWMLHRII